MENGSLVALSRQIVLQRKLSVIADNLANLTTTGFKREDLAAEEAFMPKSRTNLFQRRDARDSFVAEKPTVTDFSQGEIEKTENPFDLTILNDGFFVVQTAQGERYSRGGNFVLDNQGRLVTPDGDPVQGEGGDIVFAANEHSVAVGADGSVSSSEGAKGRLRIVNFANPGSLLKRGKNLFESTQPAQPNPNARVMQGALEKSNVSGITEINNLIQVTRAYEQVADLIKRDHDLRTRAIERLGSLQA